MKALLLAAALHGGVDAGSLGIGMDVLPEAFSFAAGRVGYAPHLTLTGCDRLRCRWDLGAGVEMTANLMPGTLSLDRIEAETDGGRAAVTGSGLSPYGKACLAIVALVAPEASGSEQRSIARSIAAPGNQGPPVRLDMPETGDSFYGAVTGGKDGRLARCGAAAASVDIGSKL